jgi:hypothetical protein
VSFVSGRKGGSGLCLGERDFNLNISTRTQWWQKKKIANCYNSHDGLMTMAALVVVATAYSNCGWWWRTAAVCSVGTSGHRRWQTMHMEQTVSKFDGNIIGKKSMLENGKGFSHFKTENK